YLALRAIIPLNAAEGSGLSPGVPPGRGPSLRAARPSPPRSDPAPRRLHARGGNALRGRDGRPLYVGVPGRAPPDGPAPPVGPGHGCGRQRIPRRPVPSQGRPDPGRGGLRTVDGRVRLRVASLGEPAHRGPADRATS